MSYQTNTVMRQRRFSVVLSLLLAILSVPFLVGFSFQKENTQRPYVVILSLDGFRWDYPTLYHTPNINRMASQGVQARSLIPSFPTTTFPNHYTIATSLYPDHHGIVNNFFYDDSLDRYYRISDRETVENQAFYGGEPLWVTAEKQGVRSAAYYWVGSEAAVCGIRPSYWKKYDESTPFSARIDTVIAWLKLPERIRPHLLMVYFHEPDETSHTFGPISPETKKEVEVLDSLVGVLFHKMDRLPQHREINFILLSDHGMAAVDQERYIDLTEYVDTSLLDKTTGSNPVISLRAKTGDNDSLYQQLLSVPHCKAWKSGSLPESFHYGSNPRVLDMVILADSAWTMGWKPHAGHSKGAHGYSPFNPDMQAIFYARGPAFRKGWVSPSFENVNIYPLVTTILSLKPAPMDGSINNVGSLLKKRYTRKN
jgi:predicted AlkP superfamily pyrophosphatase or phosphodiesterase